MINMDIDSYFKVMRDEFNAAYDVASEARSKGFDPKPYVEIKPAPDLASRVEGLINTEGLTEIIRTADKGQSRNKLAFDVAREICTNDRFSNYEEMKRIELAVRVGVAVLTEGILVAPTEGINSFAKYKNRDNTDYLCIVYAGPIRGAGGTAAALSVALADQCRRIFNISDYKPTEDEIERYLEEIELYNDRIARLQYKPPEQDIREILRNCPVCIDGMPPGALEVGVHANMKRTLSSGKEVMMTNKVRGGVPLVVCEGIAQKAKKTLKETKGVGLDWDWLNNIIKVDVKKTAEAKDAKAVFLEEIELYNDRIARLQYKPPEQDIREILRNCPVCIDGMPPGALEVGVHANMKRTLSSGKEVMMTNKVRGGVPLVSIMFPESIFAFIILSAFISNSGSFSLFFRKAMPSAVSHHSSPVGL